MSINRIWLLFNILFLNVISLSFSQYSYKPLSRNDKALFKTSIEHLKKSYAEKDFKIFVKFGEKIKTEYENILLDPSCEKIRKDYLMIDSLLREIQIINKVAATRESSKNGSEFATYDYLITLYKTNNMLDSAEKYLMLLDKFTDSITNTTIDLDLYREISLCKNINIEKKTVIRKKVENLFQEKFLQLSSSMVWDSIQSFSEQYPEIYTGDIDQLKEKSRQKERLSLLRNPSFKSFDQYTARFGNDKIVSDVVKSYYRKFLLSKLDMEIFDEYYKRYPGDDFVLFQTIEDKLFQKSVLSKNIDDAMMYMKYFPRGRYVNQFGDNTSAIVSNTITEREAK